MCKFIPAVSIMILITLNSKVQNFCDNKIFYANSLPNNDSFVTIHESKIYYHCEGVGQAVIFVSGLGDDHETWQTVQDSVSNFALTLSYDRSGLGKSEYHNEKKDLTSIVNELNNILQGGWYF